LYSDGKTGKPASSNALATLSYFLYPSAVNKVLGTKVGDVKVNGKKENQKKTKTNNNDKAYMQIDAGAWHLHPDVGKTLHLIYISSTAHCDHSAAPTNSIRNNTLTDASIQRPQESRPKTNNCITTSSKKMEQSSVYPVNIRIIACSTVQYNQLKYCKHISVFFFLFESTQLLSF